MSNLVNARAWSPKVTERVRDVLFVGAGVKLFVGARVGWDTAIGSPTRGFLVNYQSAAPSPSIVFLGTYWPTIQIGQNADNTAGANGAITAEVEFYRPKYLVWWDNDSGNPCVVGDRGSRAYATSDHEAGDVNVGGSLSYVGNVYLLGNTTEGTSGMVLLDITGIY